MSTLDHQEILASAESAIKLAQDVRIHHRKRTRPSHQQRRTDVRYARTKLTGAMKPIRAGLGRIPYEQPSEGFRERQSELRVMSKRIQVERRKLWKLQNGKRKHSR